MLEPIPPVRAAAARPRCPRGRVPSGSWTPTPARRPQRRPARAPSRRRRRRCASSPAPARARPGCSPAASPTGPPPATHDPRHVLALTFTRKAAGELTQPAARARPARPRRRRHLPRRRLRPAPRPLGRPRHRAARAARPQGRLRRPPRCPAACARRRAATSSPSTSWPRSSGPRPGWSRPSSYAVGGQGRRPHAAARRPPGRRRSSSATRTRSSARRLVDFDDLLRLCRRDLRRRRRVRRGAALALPHLFVDEFQDVNPLQQALLEAWLGDRTDLCVVGDPNQAIYAWNGADARLPRRLRRALARRREVVQPRPTTTARRRRSSPWPTPCWPAAPRRAASSAATASPAQRPPARRARCPSSRAFADDKAEARAIARAVRDHHAPGRRVVGPGGARAHQRPDRAHRGGAARGAASRSGSAAAAPLLEQPEVKAALRRAAPAPRATFADRRWPTSADRGATVADGDAGRRPATRADERQANLEALVRLAHDYAAVDANPTVAGLPRLADPRPPAPTSPTGRGDAVELSHLPRRQGPRVAGRAPRRPRAGPGAHRPRPDPGAAGRGAAPVLRRHHPGRARAAHHVGASSARSAPRPSAASARPTSTDVDAALDAPGAGEVPADWADPRQRRAAPSGRPRRGRAPARRARPAQPRRTRGRAAGALSDLDDDDETLLDALKGWRATVAKGAVGRRPTSCSTTRTLESHRQARPRSVDDLLAARRLGPVKVSRYGDADPRGRRRPRLTIAVTRRCRGTRDGDALRRSPSASPRPSPRCSAAYTDPAFYDAARRPAEGRRAEGARARGATATASSLRVRYRFTADLPGAAPRA